MSTREDRVLALDHAMRAAGHDVYSSIVASEVVANARVYLEFLSGGNEGAILSAARTMTDAVNAADRSSGA